MNMGYIEAPIDPPDHWSCEECGEHFYPQAYKEPESDESVLCYDCKNFNG